MTSSPYGDNKIYGQDNGNNITGLQQRKIATKSFSVENLDTEKWHRRGVIEAGRFSNEDSFMFIVYKNNSYLSFLPEYDQF